MNSYAYRLLNVFALEDRPLSGNPLCVFEDARGLDDVTLQALALQFNLSETTFVLPSEVATARVRIFTPHFEMPFAGHPTLGTAQVVRSLRNCGDSITLEMRAGIIPVDAGQNFWTLRAYAPVTRPVAASHEQLALMLGIEPEAVAATPLWVNTGSEQLIVPLRDAGSVRRCRPDLSLLRQHARRADTRFLVYVWAPEQAEAVCARFFFATGSSVAEDPATGSACANLGGWFIATGTTLPVHRQIQQGEAVGRPSQLYLQVDDQQQIFVSGRVLELGRGVIEL